MPDGLFEQHGAVREGERLIADVEPRREDTDRLVTELEATRDSLKEYLPVNTEGSADKPLSLMEDEDSGDLGLYEIRTTSFGRKVADVNSVTQTDRDDLDTIGIGRDRGTGEFTPDNTVPAPESPSDRNPDDGEFTTPDPRPITDIGRQRSDGLFDLF